MAGLVDQLFSVRVTAGHDHWRVLVRAATDVAAAEKVTSRGHQVVLVETARAEDLRLGGPRKAPTICLNCQYSLRGLGHGEAMEVLCPECGVTNLPMELPAKIDVVGKRRRIRYIRRGAWAFAALMIAALIIAMAWMQS